MSLFKRSAIKGDNNKRKEPGIDVNDLSPKPKRTRSPTGVYEPHKFKSYAAFQTYAKYFRDASLLVERVVDQPSLLDTKIPVWFANKDWNFFLSGLDETYENLVKEFYANAIIEGKELKCWVKGKIFSVTPTYLAKILHINRLILPNPPVYDDLCLDKDLLKDALGRNLEFSQNGNSISVSTLPSKKRVLTIIMFNNLYPLLSTGYMNLGRALFLHDLIIDEEIDICAHIFHILCKTVAKLTQGLAFLFAA